MPAASSRDGRQTRSTRSEPVSRPLRFDRWLQILCYKGPDVLCPAAAPGMRAQERVRDLRVEAPLSEPLVPLVPEVDRFVRVEAPHPGVVGLASEAIERHLAGT